MKNNKNFVDFHAHILPGADHGSHSVNVSLRQLKLAKDAGVTRIIATPHFYPHSDGLETFLDRRRTSFKNLSKCLSDDLPSIKIGAEVLLCENLDKLENLIELCIEGTDVMLIELPFSSISELHVRTVENIIDSGIKVILAHADRYKAEIIEKFIDIGAKIQLNADSLSKILLPRHIRSWIERGLVVALGSDIHGDSSKYYKNFKKAANKFSKNLEKTQLFSDEIWNKRNI